jgi:hypothetical protein
MPYRIDVTGYEFTQFNRGEVALRPMGPLPAGQLLYWQALDLGLGSTSVEPGRFVSACK